MPAWLKLSDFVGSVAQCHESEWEYDLPALDRPVTSVGIGLDGTCILMHEDGWREAMCGSIALYDVDGERLHTLYCAATPEYGKTRFHAKFTREIERVQARFPEAVYVGVADGAKDNWTFLKPYTDRRIVDFYPAREYLSKAATAIFGRDHQSRDAWVEEWSHRLKHKQGTPGRLRKELEVRRTQLDRRNVIERDEVLRQVIVYYTNNKGKMGYPHHLKWKLPKRSLKRLTATPVPHLSSPEGTSKSSLAARKRSYSRLTGAPDPTKA